MQGCCSKEDISNPCKLAFENVLKMKIKKLHHGKLKHLFSQFEGDTDLREIGPLPCLLYPTWKLITLAKMRFEPMLVQYHHFEILDSYWYIGFSKILIPYA
jgi:hypothetical protein